MNTYNEITWLDSHFLMIRNADDKDPTKAHEDYAIISTSDGTKVGMFPAKYKFVYNQAYANDERTKNELRQFK